MIFSQRKDAERLMSTMNFSKANLTQEEKDILVEWILFSRDSPFLNRAGDADAPNYFDLTCRILRVQHIEGNALGIFIDIAAYDFRTRRIDCQKYHKEFVLFFIDSNLVEQSAFDL